MIHKMDGKELQKTIKTKLQEKVSRLEKKLTLAVVSVGFNEASKIYISQKEKMAYEIGYNFLSLHFDFITEENLEKEIEKLNQDRTITGIIVQLPLPDYLNQDRVLNFVATEKDVDGLTDRNQLLLFQNKEGLIPCTPKGILTLIKSYQIELAGKNVVVIGRSKLVGLPLSILLLNQNATVTICHSKTIDLEKYTKKADILISAVGKKDLIQANMIKEGAVLIDVGINRVNDNLYGDINKDCLEKASLMTPVPGGVGPMTVISLMENVYLANLYQERKYKELQS